MDSAAVSRRIQPTIPSHVLTRLRLKITIEFRNTAGKSLPVMLVYRSKGKIRRSRGIYFFAAVSW